MTHLLALIGAFALLALHPALPAQAKEIDPTDPNAGRFVLRAPRPNIISPEGFALVSSTGDRTNLYEGSEVYVLKGKYCLEHNTPYQRKGICGIEIKAQEQTSYKYSIVHLDYDPRAFRPDIGPRLALRTREGGAPLDSFNVALRPDAYLAILPGPFKFEYFSPDAATAKPMLPPPAVIDVPAGSLVEAHLTPAPDSWTSEVTVDLDAAHFNDPIQLGCARHGKTALFAIIRTDAGSQEAAQAEQWAPPAGLAHDGAVPGVGLWGMGMRAFLELEPTESTGAQGSGRHARFRAAVLDEPGMHYEIVASNLPERFAPKTGAGTSVRIPRADINDVQLTQNQPNSPLIPGRFNIYVSDPSGADGWKLVRYLAPLPRNAGEDGPGTYLCRKDDPVAWVSGFDTRTGLDLPPGRYKVVVSYEYDHTPGTQTFEFDL